MERRTRFPRYHITFHVAIALVMLVAAGCSNHGTEPTLTVPSSQDTSSQSQGVSFQSNVRPIFERFGCASCHGGNGGLTVTTVADLLRGGDHGPAIVAGKPESSNLIAKLSASPPFGSRMPQGGPYLPDSTVQVIRLWITQGAKNN